MYTKFLNDIRKFLTDEEITLNADMRLYTSFKAGGTTDILLQIKELNNLKTTLALLTAANIPYSIIGNGTNILVKDSGYRGVLIRIVDHMKNITVKEDHIITQAGVLLSTLSRVAADHCLGGLEFLSGIPGSVGGAVCMNAGAYNGEMKDVLVNADILYSDGSIKTLSTGQLNLSYRNSDVKDSGAVVLGAVFKGIEKNQEEIYHRMTQLNTRRRDKQPLEYPSAGSTFKRPEGYFAGKLIEDCNLKGKGVGGAKVSEKHAGFIINYNNATAQDIIDTIEMVRDVVFKTYHVTLENEVKVIG
jgi:UDP-N-acetylmuramate dehydrogenase